MLDKVNVAVSCRPPSGSVTATVAIGRSVAVSATTWLATAPVITGGKSLWVATTLVAALLLCPAVSVTASMKPVDTDRPTCTWRAVGVNNSASTAAVTCEVVPVTR